MAHKPLDERDYYLVREAAEYLGLSMDNTYKALREGDIPARRFGTAYRIPKARFHAWFGGKEVAEEPQSDIEGILAY